MEILKSKIWISVALITVVTVIFCFVYQRWMKNVPAIKNIRLEYKITIPEGWSVWQIGESLAQKKKIKNIENTRVFWEKYQNMEGFLFPDTYRVFQDTTMEEVADRFRENFLKKINDVNNDREYSNFAEALNDKDLQRIMIIASIVEREAKKDEDRAKIAGIYFNRLASGMNLEADPTVQYGRDLLLIQKREENFKPWEAITKSDYRKVDSPYNTYIRNGLPPGPICNPGIASVKAAFNPEQHDYYYFFNLKDGTTVYSRSKEEHEKNKIKYKNER